MKRIVAVLGVACMAAIVIAERASAQNPPARGMRWSRAAPFPEPEEELYGTVVNGKFYVIGGFGFTPPGVRPPPPGVSKGPCFSCPPALVYEYDPGPDKWTKKKTIPTPVHHQAQAAYNGKIYIFGGCTRAISGEGGSTNVWEYDPAADAYRAMAPMPVKRCSAIAEEVGGKIYVIGGRIGAGNIPATTNVDVVEEYDPATNLWGPIKDRMPTPRSGGGAATYNGKIYVGGGELQNRQLNAAFRALEAYDPASNTWDVLPSMPSARHGNAMGFLGNKLHVVSGKMEGGGAPDMAGTDHPYATAAHDVLEIPSGTQ